MQRQPSNHRFSAAHKPGTCGEDFEGFLVHSAGDQSARQEQLKTPRLFRVGVQKKPVSMFRLLLAEDQVAAEKKLIGALVQR